MKPTLRTRLIIGYAVITVALIVSAIIGYYLLDDALKSKDSIRVHTDIVSLSDTLFRLTLEARSEVDRFLTNPNRRAPEVISEKINLLEKNAAQFQLKIQGSTNYEQLQTAQAIIDAVNVYKENFVFLNESIQRSGFNDLTGHNANLNFLENKLDKFLTNEELLTLKLIKLEYQTLSLTKEFTDLRRRMGSFFSSLLLNYPEPEKRLVLKEFQGNLERLMFEVVNLKDLIPLLHLNEEMIKMFADDNVQTARLTLKKQFEDGEKLGEQQRLFLLIISLGAVLAGVLSISILGMAPLALIKLSREQASILEAITDGLIAVNKEGVITLINSSAKKILNIQDDYLGRHIKEVLPTSKLPWTLKTKKIQYYHEHQLGATTVIITRIPIIINDRVMGGISVFREKGELTKLVGKLVQVNAYIDALRASNHEFKNRLQTIQGMIQLQKNEEVLHYIKSLQDSHQLQVSLYVDHIKDPAISAILLGKYNRSHELGISLFLEKKTELGVLDNAAIRNGIVSIIGNLIDNAIDSVLNNSIDQREINVLIRELKSSYYFSVRDNGPGIPDKLAEKIFTQGFSTKSSRSIDGQHVGINREAHMGMGLYITQNYVLALGGEIQFKSNQGTCFEVTIPKA